MSIDRPGKYFFIFLMIGLMISCRHSYNPPAIINNDHILVVGGFINSGQNAITTINLSRTQNLTDSTAISNPEPNAQITIESQTGSSYALHGQADGNYLSDPLNLDNSTTYRLRIVTSDGKNYLSDFIPVKQTPAIDSVSWQQNNDVNIYVDTHDPQNNARYYRWDFVETWEHLSILSGTYGVKNGMIFIKDSTTETDSCWTTLNSTNIVVGTSIALSNDVISHQLVATIFQNDERIENRYSILVRQYALTADAYQYRLNLQKNTQLMGTIFDPQPLQLNTNIHNSANADEPVIGYISASNVQEKRIFISHKEVTDWNYSFPSAKCDIVNIARNPVNDLIFNYPDTSYDPYYFVTFDGLNIMKKFCLECQYQGGVTTRPSFW